MTFLLRYWRYIAVVLVLAAVIGFVYAKGHKAGLAAGRAELEAFRQEVGARILEANQRAEQAAADFEEWKRKQRPKVITVVKEVDRVIEANPEWSRTALPDGVRDALTAAAAELGAGEPAGALPAVSGLDLADECRSCQGLPRGADLGTGMQSEASPAQ
jgi:hypothetical protein